MRGFLRRNGADYNLQEDDSPVVRLVFCLDCLGRVPLILVCGMGESEGLG